MFTVSPDLTSIVIGAGEPILLWLALQEMDGTPTPLTGRAFVLTAYRNDRTVLSKIDGEASSDGTFLRFEEDGSWSNALYGKNAFFELDERLRGGRDRIAGGSLIVQATAADVASLDNGVLGKFAVQIAARKADAAGDKLVFTRSVVAYVAPGSTPAPAVTARPSIATDGTPQVGETMTGQSGTYTNGSVTARAWLLGGTAISGATGATYVPQQTGSLVYRETVAGSGGTITSDSDPVTIAAAATTTPLTLSRNTANASARPGQGIGTFFVPERGATLSLADDAGGAVKLTGYELVLGATVPSSPGTVTPVVRKTLADGSHADFPVQLSLGVQPTLADTFQGASGTALVGRNTSTGGKTWAGDAGWTLDGAGNIVAPAASGSQIATVDAGSTSYFLTGTLRSYSDGVQPNHISAVSLANLTFRYKDASNYFYVRPEVRSAAGGAAACVTLCKLVGGTETELLCVGWAGGANVDLKAAVRVVGSEITLFIEGREVATLIDADLATATGVGVGAGQGGSPASRARFSQFDVSPIMGTRVNWMQFNELDNTTPVVPRGPAGAWDSTDLNNPNVLYDPVGKRWVMDYTGYHNPGQDNYYQSVGNAYSSSIAGPWTKDPNNPVLPYQTSEGAIAGMNGGRIWSEARKLFIEAYGTANAQGISLATSPDGITWTRTVSGVVPTNKDWKASGVFDAMLRRTVDGRMELWYCGHSNDNNGNNRNYGRMSSPDEGLTWVDEATFSLGGALTMQNGGVDSLFQVDAGEPYVWSPASASPNHLLVVHDGVKTVAGTLNNQNPENRSLNMAVTFDNGVTWRRRVDALRGSGTGFESKQVFDCCLVDDGTTAYLYHSAADISGAALDLDIAIGLATAPVPSSLLMA